MRNRCSYAGLVSAYFSVYLAGTKNVSTNTIYSYRDTFVIFHGYLEKYCGFKLEKMLFNDLSRELILEFLQYLETERKCSISSRNQRLAALKSFAKYVQIECPDEMILCQRILSIDSKKAAKPTVQYLSNQQTDILMEQPDISTPKGRRDLAMILLLYDSAARVQELCDLRIPQDELTFPPARRRVRITSCSFSISAYSSLGEFSSTLYSPEVEARIYPSG